eukprot:CAMPEP_0174874558 /NCGR_PEP_ID=MMETSP1114-20130205/76935_1 /TAXON_ID=312471 /ORGANISM="Neobodo designis, Strain CCAP 1951/1" /LENGTH=374 /DNA_ID=CAMNT_0016109893 /DNA_START=1 /DNA_END=1121 /DNA_ORIENTATION=+
MLKEQKETLEASIIETEERLAREADEVATLQRDLIDREQEAHETQKQLQRLQREEHDHLLQEMSQEQHTQQLMSDAHTARKKFDNEVELRYAQKLVNARRLRKEKEAAQVELDKLQAEQDLSLSAVILDAAEQYERRVRQYADEDTHVKNRIRKAEALIPQLVSKREEVEKDCARLQNLMRTRDREMAGRLDETEAEWKKKYTAMKHQYEEEIAALEAEHYQERRRWDEDLDDEDAATTAENQMHVNELESRVRTKETEWSSKVASRCAELAEVMDKRVKESTEQSSLRLAEVRHRYERRIGEQYALLRKLQSMCDEHDAAMESLSQQVAPVTHQFEDIKTLQPPASASPEYRRLQTMLREFSAAYQSVPARSA